MTTASVEAPMPTLQKTDNKATFRHFCDAMNTGDPEVISTTIDELVEPDAVIRTPLPLDSTGRDKLKEVFARLHRAFPDLLVTVEDLIAEDDKVVARNTVTGTHRVSTWVSSQPVSPSLTTKFSFSGSLRAGSLRPGASSTSSRRCDSSA
jgi:predicted ester cyclase